MMKRLSVCLLVVVAIAFFGACEFDFSWSMNWDDYRYQFDDYFESDLGGIKNVSATIINGHITVETWDEEKISIEVDERIKADDEDRAQEIADAVKLVGRTHGDSLEITLDYGDMHKWRKRYGCHLNIKIPADRNIEFDTTNGKISVAPMNADVILESTNGSIHLEGATGKATLDTTNGAIIATGLGGEVRADTTNGRIELSSYSGPVFAETTNGEVDVEITDLLAGDVSLDSTNGAVSLTLPDDSSFEVEADTSNGSISDDLPNADFDYNRKRNHMEGRYKGGEYRVRLDTTNGGISIRGK